MDISLAQIIMTCGVSGAIGFGIGRVTSRKVSDGTQTQPPEEEEEDEGERKNYKPRSIRDALATIKPSEIEGIVEQYHISDNGEYGRKIYGIIASGNERAPFGYETEDIAAPIAMHDSMTSKTLIKMHVTGGKKCWSLLVEGVEYQRGDIKVVISNYDEGE